MGFNQDRVPLTYLNDFKTYISILPGRSIAVYRLASNSSQLHSRKHFDDGMGGNEIGLANFAFLRLNRQYRHGLISHLPSMAAARGNPPSATQPAVRSNAGKKKNSNPKNADFSKNFPSSPSSFPRWVAAAG